VPVSQVPFGPPGLFQEIPVPAGTSTVQFDFLPPYEAPAFIAAFLALVALIGSFFVTSGRLSRLPRLPIDPLLERVRRSRSRPPATGPRHRVSTPPRTRAAPAPRHRVGGQRGRLPGSSPSTPSTASTPSTPSTDDGEGEGDRGEDDSRGSGKTN